MFYFFIVPWGKTVSVEIKFISHYSVWPERKRPLGRPRRRWEDGVRMDLRGIGLGGGGFDSTVSGQGPVAGCCECGDEPSGSCATEFVIIPRGIVTYKDYYQLLLFTYLTPN
jgi:hypothetical protein